MLRMAGRIGVDDEGAVHALVDVPLQRQGVAMIEVAAERPRVELVDELTARLDHSRARHAVHARRVDAVEVHRVRMGAFVAEDDPQPVAFGRANGRARHPPVVGPGREEEAGGDLDLLVLADDLVGAERAAVGKLRHRSRVPVRQHGGRIEAVAGAVHVPDRHHVAVGRVDAHAQRAGLVLARGRLAR